MRLNVQAMRCMLAARTKIDELVGPDLGVMIGLRCSMTDYLISETQRVYHVTFWA